VVTPSAAQSIKRSDRIDTSRCGVRAQFSKRFEKAMSDLYVVRIPHSLGKIEATRRIARGVDEATAVLPRMVRLDHKITDEGPILMAVRALGQSVTAVVTVEDRYVVVEASVPAFLAPFVEKAKSFTRSYASKLLSGPVSGQSSNEGSNERAKDAGPSKSR
jgi:hypothetical protein